MDLETPRRRRGKELEDAILTAAWDELVASGYAGLTIEAVAERAKTSRPVIYRRWRERNELISDAIAHELGRRHIETPDTGSLRGDMIEVLRRSNVLRAQLLPLMSVIVGSSFAGGTTFADVRERAFADRPGRSAVDEVLDRAVARHEVDPKRLTRRARTVAFDLFRHDLVMTLQPLSDERIVEIVDDVFLPVVGIRHPVESDAGRTGP